MLTVPSACTVPMGRSFGSLQVIAVSPERAAGFLLMNTVVLPLVIFPLLEGGLTNVPPIATWGGVLVAVLSTVAAGLPMMFTSVLRPSSRIPEKGCPGVSTGCPDGGWMLCVSDAVILSPFLAAAFPMGQTRSCHLVLVIRGLGGPHLLSTRPAPPCQSRFC